MRRLLASFLALSLAGCGMVPLLTGIPTAPPAPLAQTAFDEKALVLGWSAYDATLTAIDAFVASKRLVKNTPKAIAVKGYIEDAERWLDAATAARRAGSAARYDEALGSASTALKLALSAMKGN